MERPDLARLLATASAEEQHALLAANIDSIDRDLAYTLKQMYDEQESSDPALAAGASTALSTVAEHLDDPLVTGLAAWVSGMAALDRGDLGTALASLENAEGRFLDLDQPHTAASTQVSKLIVLAILGRYDEAFETGLRARDLFLATGDELAAGKIEQNLGNIHGRRERHAESEALFRAARERFLVLDDQKQLAQIDNCLGTALKWQHQFREAEDFYRQALTRARAENLEMTAAEVEANLGLLELFQGRYDTALDYLERSRRHFAQLDIPHETALSEQEIASVYLELSLAPEALEMCDRAIPIFSALGMRAEHARALLSRGRALRMLGRDDEALETLAAAESLYKEEDNALGAGMVTLTRAEMFRARDQFREALDAAAAAEDSYADSGVLGRLLTARWLRGDALQAAGRLDEADSLLHDVLASVTSGVLPQIEHHCRTSLGLLALRRGDATRAEMMFTGAIEGIEALRAPLPAEEFRTAFLADKLTPYSEMVRICLADQPGERIAEAFSYVERARSRVLADLLAGGLQVRVQAGDPVEADMLARLEALREELNWYYSQMNRAQDSESLRGPALLGELQAAARDRERAILEIQRQLVQQGQQLPGTGAEQMDVSRLQALLDTDTAVLAYYSLDDELCAFVVTSSGIELVESLGSEHRVRELVTALRFQLETLRYGSGRLGAHMDQLTRRAQRHLAELYDLLFAPLEPLLVATDRVAVVPHRSLHYVPFHALYDGSGYLVERFEFALAPSANVLAHCLRQPMPDLERMLVMGVPDQHIPHVRDEVEALAGLFPETLRFEDERATLAALHEHAPQADVLHLACHGYFRPDNPLFSALQLADGRLTVRDAYQLDLQGGLVTLSACETGVSDIAPGDELIGLARGFISAGAPTILMSLWTVDDDATARLMASFYQHVRAGARPGAALRCAQIELLGERAHPFYWSPFVLMGRW